MLGVYFSGTGNSRYALERFLVGCGKCVRLCPMKNLRMEDHLAKAGN